MSRLGDAALQYARRGWPVFPVWPRRKNPRLGEGGHKHATTDAGQVAQWWAGWPDANIGLCPGPAGLLVLDWDSEEGRQEAVRLRCYAEPTLIVETARGQHLYFRHPGGRIGNRKLNGVLDVRADAGYVLLPPSIHPSGVIYRALGRIEEIRDLPSPALAALQEAAPRPRTPGAPISPPIDAGTPRRRAYVASAVANECLELANTGEGGRNNKLNDAAFSLARFVATGEAHPDALADTLRFAAQQAGLEEDEIERTIQSAFRARETVA